MDLQQKHYDYSMKNIPIPSKESYTKCLISKVESFIMRIRWKVYFYNQPESDEQDVTIVETYGLKTNKCPPQDEHLKAFEQSLYDLIQQIQFRDPGNNKFLRQLNKDKKEIQKSNNILVFADKTNNLYEIKKENYCKVLNDNVTQTYKKSDPILTKKINKEAQQIAKTYRVENRMEHYSEKPAFLTFKDHKENFQSSLKCRLINPAKSEIGLISKKILDKHNAAIRNATHILQWRQSKAVIDWFKDIDNKHQCKFMKFDIVDFYPSITKDLLLKSIEFAKQYTNITDLEVETILHAKKSLLFDRSSTWIKRTSQDMFDVTMGSYDGAETCELVGLFIMSKLTEIFGINNIGLFRDDGLAIMKKASGPKTDRARKDIIEIFKQHNLKITVECNLQTTEYLDIFFDLKSGKHRPYVKPNNTTIYVDKNSNHPPIIIKNLPEMIETRLTTLSSDINEFDKVKDYYQNALKKGGYDKTLKFNQQSDTKSKRKRKIIWFNPPYSKSVKTNIGRQFLKLVDQFFPTNHRYRKLFNRNTIKVSYSCMQNMKQIINQHNAKILEPKEDKNQEERTCNCRDKKSCPLDGNCLKQCVVYQATVTTEDEKKIYIGQTEEEFKTRYNNHKKSFTNTRYKNETTLSKYVWTLKEKNKEYNIKWKVLRTTKKYKCGTRKCMLCLEEKYQILTKECKEMLNKKTEIISTCRHRKKYLLSSMK